MIIDQDQGQQQLGGKQQVKTLEGKLKVSAHRRKKVDYVPQSPSESEQWDEDENQGSEEDWIAWLLRF